LLGPVRLRPWQKIFTVPERRWEREALVGRIEVIVIIAADRGGAVVVMGRKMIWISGF
jgi:hypothetical protein